MEDLEIITPAGEAVELEPCFELTDAALEYLAAEGRLNMLLAASLPDSDHPGATAYVLDHVRATLSPKQSEGEEI